MCFFDKGGPPRCKLTEPQQPAISYELGALTSTANNDSAWSYNKRSPRLHSIPGKSGSHWVSQKLWNNPEGQFIRAVAYFFVMCPSPVPKKVPRQVTRDVFFGCRICPTSLRHLNWDTSWMTSSPILHKKDLCRPPKWQFRGDGPFYLGCAFGSKPCW
jgi:hypothetical protein